jgi:23S rRNA (cytosine1962-C5)-methyltransferase
VTAAGEVRLRPGRDKSLRRRHPWLFSGAIDSVRGDPANGATVALLDSGGEFLAWAAYSAHSQLRARVWSWDAAQPIDADFFRRRLTAAIARRAAWMDGSDAARLVHAESDGLPGLILDRYGDTLVMQLLSSGPEFHRDTLADLALELSGAARLYERSDVDVRALDGLPERVGPLRGSEPPDPVLITEDGLRFAVDVRRGHKTGHYLDQRRNRLTLRGLAAGRDTLDCFCYTGGFSVNLLAGGAKSVVGLDASGPALALAEQNLALNGLADGRFEPLEGDVFQKLRTFRDSRRSFDLIVLDPPKFAQNAAQAERAARGYKDINLLALKLLRPGGLLATFSCSGGVDAALFQKIVAGAALDAGVSAQILGYFQQGPDHPVALAFPEGAYLKGLLVGVA